MTSRPGLRQRLRAKAARRLFDRAIRYANHWSQDFTTFHQRPKFTRQIGTWRDSALPNEPAAIVMQGPVATQDDFTLETLKLYRQHMPGVRLILSTWNDTPEAILAPMAALGIEVVRSEKPGRPGLFNINMQITSASNGVRRAVEGGAEWVLKTRTDQRLYAPDVMPFLIATARTFPVTGGGPQRHRIIGVGLGSLKFAPYHVTDQTVFGHAEDMMVYWTPPLRGDPPEGWPSSISDVYGTIPVGMLCRHGAPESYFASEFLRRRGWPLDWTIEDTWAAYRDRFCFVDVGATDLYWVKSQTYSLAELLVRYEIVSNRHEMGFRDWMLLYSGQLAAERGRDYEGTVDLSFRADPADVASGWLRTPNGREIRPVPIKAATPPDGSERPLSAL